MTAIWNWIVGLLIWLSAEPSVVQCERPRCCAAVHAARASMCKGDAAPTPKPDEKVQCCKQCNGTGYLTMPDGHRVKCPCPPNCPCLKKPGAPKPECPDGKCPLPRK